MDRSPAEQTRITLASLVFGGHPYFETRYGNHAHLVVCFRCLAITLELGDIIGCQTCGQPLLALERDLILHLADPDWLAVP